MSAAPPTDPWEYLNRQAKQLTERSSLDTTDAAALRLERAELHDLARHAWNAAGRIALIRTMHSPPGLTGTCPACQVRHPCPTYTETLRGPS